MKTIKMKLLCLIVSMVFTICLCLSLASLIAATFAIRNTVNRDIESMAEQTSKTVHLSLDNRLNVLRNAFTGDLIKGVQEKTANGRLLLKNAAISIGAERIGVCGPDGEVHYSDGKTVKSIDQEYITKALDGKDYISVPQPSVANGEMVIVYAVPVKIGGVVCGAVVLEDNAVQLSQLVNDIDFGKTGGGFVIDKDGTVIGHSDQKYVDKKYNPMKEGKEKQLIALIKDMQKKKSGFKGYAAGKKRMNAGFASIEGTDWTVAVTIEHREVYAPLISLLKQLSICGIIFFVFCSGIGYGFGKKIGNRITDISEQLGTVAKGDLTESFDKKKIKGKDEIVKMNNGLQKMRESISCVVATIKKSTNSLTDKSSQLSNASSEISDLSDRISTSINEIAQGTSVQTNELIEVTNILSQFGEKLQDVIRQIADVDEVAMKIDSMSVEGSEGLSQMRISINHIQDTFQVFENNVNVLEKNISEVYQITNVIQEMAEQTNLLALNASIEAARAGDAGKGFAVVAQEIGSLADQSKNSTASIATIINQITSNANQIVSDSAKMGSELFEQITIINHSIETFHQIVEEIAVILPKTDKMKESSNQIANDKNNIIEKIEEITATSEEITASSQEITASTYEMNASINSVADSAKTLNDMTVHMLSEVNHFTIQKDMAEEGMQENLIEDTESESKI